MHATATTPNLTNRVRTYASFVRFEHTLFSLPLILAGIFSAPGRAMPAARWALIALAAVGARTAAMAINRLADRRLDALNPRTRVRELPSGAMSSAEGWGLLLASLAIYFGVCALLGRWYVAVAFVPLAAFIVYPYLKRFTPLCHFGVGAALALAPLAGYAAAHPDLAEPRAAILLAVFAFLWVSGFDIIYATLDEAFDRAHGVHSMVVWLGRRRALRVSAVLHGMANVALAVMTILVLRAGGARSPLAAIIVSTLALCTATTLLVLEQRWAERVDLAFFKVNVWVGACVLLTVLAARIRF